jgi:hypothetical protein
MASRGGGCEWEGRRARIRLRLLGGLDDISDTFSKVLCFWLFCVARVVRFC